MGIPPAGNTVYTAYHYGFTSQIGAGPYDQRLFGAKLPEPPAPVQSVSGGGAGLTTATGLLGAQGGIVIGDSLTYGAPADVGAGGGLQKVAIIGKNKERPVIRWTASPRPEWVFTGAADADLMLQGLYLVGADVVLRGQFRTVQIRYSTLDPGTSGADLEPPALYRTSVDGFALAPTRLFVEAKVRTLTLERCITGPVRTRDGGGVELLEISDSIVQDIASGQAIDTESGQVQLVRTTVLGPIAVHRLDASECILNDVAVAEDAQHGCVRFSAYAEGSIIHQPYESVTVTPQAPLFRTRTFGQPDYARLRDGVDEAITSGRRGASITTGAQNGSEMGAFASENIPLKQRGLRAKFAEFMPIGLVPVWIDVT
jgi:hypothetical protein